MRRQRQYKEMTAQPNDLRSRLPNNDCNKNKIESQKYQPIPTRTPIRSSENSISHSEKGIRGWVGREGDCIDRAQEVVALFVSDTTPEDPIEINSSLLLVANVDV